MRRLSSEIGIRPLIDALYPVDPDTVTPLSDGNAIIHKLLEIEHDADIMLQISAIADRSHDSAEAQRVVDSIRSSAFAIKECVAECVRMGKRSGTQQAILAIAKKVCGCYIDAVELTRILCGSINPALVDCLNESI
jgi:hypothetical protein